MICALLGVAVLAAPALWATDGDNLIGIGPVSRAMGGVGLAAPQDAISAIFANPAAMCFGSYCPHSEVVFGGTLFSATVKSTIDLSGMGMGSASATSRMNSFVVPAIAVTSPITGKLRLGVGAYGVSGMGVDYKDRGPLYRNPDTGQDLYTKLEIMKFVASLGYRINQHFSIGAALSMDYGNLDLAAGGSHNYAVGLKLGALWHQGIVNFGFSYTTPQKITHDRVANFDEAFGSTTMDNLTLEAPQNLSAGVAISPSSKLLVEMDVRWTNWGSAEGYQDFDWQDQWTGAIGVQYRPVPALAIRAGYNYSDNPVKTHDGFDPMGVMRVQGVNVPAMQYEMLRIVGFPAIVQNHATVGVGFDLNDVITVNLSYMHAFDESISESSLGNLARLASSNSEDAFSFDVVWHF